MIFFFPGWKHFHAAPNIKTTGIIGMAQEGGMGKHHSAGLCHDVNSTLRNRSQGEEISVMDTMLVLGGLGGGGAVHINSHFYVTST